MREAQPSLDIPKNRELLESLLTIEGSVGSTYNRFYRYSPRNIGFLAMQGCPIEPVATYRRWGELGRQVQRGEKAYSILRPIQVKVEDQETGEDKLVKRFKVVRALFAVSQTAGEALPAFEPPKWSKTRALGALAITEIPFESFDGNIQGFSYERKLAVSPVAAYPFKTWMHEAAHIQAGHTTPEHMQLYEGHRGLYEFEAEATAHLVLNELGVMDQFNPAESRAYIQHWLQDETPPEASFRTVLNTTDVILRAGYEELEEAA